MSARAGANQPAQSARVASGYALAHGLRLQHRYVLLEPIGFGGMSEVWRADDEVLRRPVAVKALAPDLATDPGLRAGVRREARAVAALNHPHVARVYDYGESFLVDGAIVAYLVMELVEGGPLAARLALGPLPWPEAARTAGQVAAALAAAHRARLVHRDVKPANVMLTPAGAKVLDFGIAAAARSAPATGSGAPVGTPAYAAPEWLDGAPPHPAADVYGVGALLYEALTGQPAVRARTWEEAADVHRHAAPLLPPDVAGLPAWLADLCLACLAPDPRDRPSAVTVAAALGAGHPRPARSVRTTVRRLRSGGSTPAPPQPRPATAAGRSRLVLAGLPRLVLAGLPRLGAPAGLPRLAALTRLTPPDGRVRLTALALVGVAVISSAGLMLAAAGLINGDADGPGAALAPPVAAASAPARPTPSSPASSPTATAAVIPLASPATDLKTATPAVIINPATVLAEFDRRLTDATAAGRVRPDVAVDLRNTLADLRNRIAQGRPEDLRPRAADLRQKLSERLAERAIDARTAAQLTALLEPLLN